MTVERHESGASANAGATRVSVLDEALWSRFGESQDIAEAARVWLALQIRQFPGALAGAVVLREGAEGFAPVARWPAEGALEPALGEAVETALGRDAPALAGASRAIALPLKLDGEVVGAAGLFFEAAPPQPKETIRQFRWGMGWLAEAVRGALMGRAADDRRRMADVIDLVGAVLDARSYAGACLAATNLLARRLGCAQAGLGFVRRRRLRLEALSDVADFRLNTGRTRAIERAMTEATDQEGTVLHPPRPGQPFMIDLAHAELAREANLGELLTVPMFSGERVVGTLHLQKASGKAFGTSDVMVAEGAAAILGPILVEKQLLDRSLPGVARDAVVRQLGRLFGPRFLGRKLALLALAGLVAFFAVAEAGFRVKADAEVQGRVVRSVAAPFDGSISAQYVRAGDSVRDGDLLARLDETDLRIELLRAETDISRYEGEYDRALADRDAPEARIASASLAEARARAELIAAQLARAELRAPFDAVVTSGDLSQLLGAAVRRGEELFQIAPLRQYRVRIEVDETDLDEIEVGQTGDLVLASLPGEAFAIRVTRITPSTEAQDGRNVALVEGELLGEPSQVRPGMRGIAKVAIEERLLVDIWSRPIIDWLRLAAWRWTP